MNENDLSLNKHLENLNHFVESTHLTEAKEQLLEMLYASMTSKYLDEMGMETRTDVMGFYVLLSNLIESIYWLAIPIFERFQFKIPAGLKREKQECPYCESIINFKHD